MASTPFPPAKLQKSSDIRKNLGKKKFFFFSSVLSSLSFSRFPAGGDLGEESTTHKMNNL